MICASCGVDIVFIFIVLCMLRANLGAAISITFTVTNVATRLLFVLQMWHYWRPHAIVHDGRTLCL